MAYNILFKKGSYSDFKTKVLNGTAAEGTLYFTEDEGGLYLGVKKSDNSVVAQRIQGVVQQFATLSDFQQDVQPPYATDVIYYIADKSALIKWVANAEGNGGGHFEILNATAAELATEISAREALAGRVVTVEDTVAGHVTAITGLQSNVATNTSDINDIKDTLGDLIGSESAGGTIAGQIAAAVAEEKTRAEAAELALDQKISTNATDISELTTDLTQYQKTVSNTYATKEELTTHSNAAAATYATKDELTTHSNAAAATYATKDELTAVSRVANEAAALANTNATAISTLEGSVNNYKNSNDQALAKVKETAEGAVTQADYDAKMLLLDTEDETIRNLIASEQERAENVEADHETRISNMETFWDATDNPDEVIDTLAEIVSYIESDKSGADEMLAKINQNTDDIDTLEGYVGIPASGSGDNAVAATGLHLAVATLNTNLANEVTNRTGAVTNAITECKEYTDTALTWGSF